MLGSIARKKIKALAREKQKGQVRNFLNWKDVKSLALILEDGDTGSKHQIDQFLEKLNKHVQVFYLELSSKKISFADWSCFTRKDKTLLGLPKKNILDNLHKLKFDLVINAAPNAMLFSEAMASSIQSQCMCSASAEFGHSNLVVRRGANQNLQAYLENVIHYLKMIRNQ